jgi:hypothetical protein
MTKKQTLIIAAPVLIAGLYLSYMVLANNLAIPFEKTYTEKPSFFNESLYDDVVKVIIGLTTVAAYWYVLSSFISRRGIKVAIVIVTVLVAMIVVPIIDFAANGL